MGTFMKLANSHYINIPPN